MRLYWLSYTVFVQEFPSEFPAHLCFSLIKMMKLFIRVEAGRSSISLLILEDCSSLETRHLIISLIKTARAVLLIRCTCQYL